LPHKCREIHKNDEDAAGEIAYSNQLSAVSGQQFYAIWTGSNQSKETVQCNEFKAGIILYRPFSVSVIIELELA
jgi:hypothetical protein